MIEEEGEDNKRNNRERRKGRTKPSGVEGRNTRMKRKSNLRANIR